jgi:hypothetical protein
MSKIVLADLADQCHARSQTFSEESAGVSAFNEGKRWVWLRIVNTCGLTEDQIEVIEDQAKAYEEED